MSEGGQFKRFDLKIAKKYDTFLEIIRFYRIFAEI